MIAQIFTNGKLKVLNQVLVCLALLLVFTGCRVQTASETPDGSTPVSGEALGTEFLSRPGDQHIRVMSFNVYWDSIFPEDDPLNDRFWGYSKGEAFVRIVKAIDPDVLCLQEINPRRDPDQVAAILDGAIPLDGNRKWQATSGTDNVIASRFELNMRAEQVVQTGPITDFGHALALVDLPDETFEPDLYMICAHFKSQGGEANIQARQEHADAVVAWLRDVETSGGEIDLPEFTPIVVLGDFNVYDTDPAYHLTTLLEGDIVNEAEYGADFQPDWDDTSLADALPRHNGGDEAVYTWRDDTQEFNPGVLDRILYSDSVIAVENAFVLNTTIMTQAELEAAGLQAGDVTLDLETGVYDHLPLVVDISFSR